MTVFPAEQRIQPHDSAVVASLLLLVASRSFEAASYCCESSYETTALLTFGVGLVVATVAKKSAKSIFASAVKRLEFSASKRVSEVLRDG
jgi:hypothetical protein